MAVYFKKNGSNCKVILKTNTKLNIYCDQKCT